MKKVFLVILLLSFFLFANVVSASEDFGISIDCVQSCQDKEIDYSKDLIIQVSIKNNTDYWIELGKEGAWDAPNLSLEVIHSNLSDGKDIETHNGLLGRFFIIKPRSELQVFTKLDSYNNLDKDKRLGTWQVIPEFSNNGIKYYKSPYDLKPVYAVREIQISSTTIGNVLEFKVTKPKVDIPTNLLVIPDTIWDNPLNAQFIFPILVGVIVLIIGAILFWIVKRKKKR